MKGINMSNQEPSKKNLATPNYSVSIMLGVRTDGQLSTHVLTCLHLINCGTKTFLPFKVAASLGV